MNILFVIGEQLCPVNSGGRVVIYERIKNLSKTNNVYIFLVSENEIDDFNKQKINQICKDACYSNYDSGMSRLCKSIYLPYSVSKRSSRKINREFDEFISDKHIDVIVYEGPQLCRIGYKSSIKKVIDFHNIEYKSLANITASLKGIKKIIYKYETIKLYLYEKKLYKRVNDAYIFISENDRDLFEKCFGYINVPKIVSPAGCYNHFIENKLEQSPKENNNNNIIIVGNMAYLPNSTGAIWFVNNVFSKLENYPGKLYVVGKNPPEELIRLASDKIVVTGEVELLEPYYDKCSIVVVPIFVGGGIKTKLVEATSYKKIILSTEFGVVGSTYDSNDVIICKNDTDFISELNNISYNKPYYEKYVNNSYEKFLNCYEWELIIKEYNDFLKKIIK